MLETAALLKISALAAATGTTTPTIRFYEEIGLLPPANRQAGGPRRYGEGDVRRLTFIRRCRDFGFSVEQVRALVELIEDSGRNCTDAGDIARGHLDAVRANLAELRALERNMVTFVERCDNECAGRPGPACVPLAELTHHASRPASPPLRRPKLRPQPANRGKERSRA